MSRRRAVFVVTVALWSIFGGAAQAAPLPDTTPPTTPTDLRVIGSTATSVTLRWNPSTDNSGSLHYVLTDNFGQIAYPQQSHTTFTMPNPWPATTYTYTLRAADFARNHSGPAVVSHMSAPDVTPPTSPVLSVNYLAPARMSVSWTRAVDDIGWFVTHTLFVNGAPRTGDPGGATAQTLLDLTPSTLYTMVVTARDPSGNASTSNTVTATTPAQTDFTPPTAPTNLRGRADVGSCEVYLSWGQSTDNADQQGALLYRFRADGALSPPSSFVIGGGTNVGRSVLEGPVPGPTTFTVEAIDGSGNVSAPSNGLVLNVDHY
jgi:chitodextrinase